MPETVNKGRISWDTVGKRLYEIGADRCVLYFPDSAGKFINGVPWNGFTGLTESPSGAEATALYANNAKYLNLYSAEEFGYTINAYTYPDEFAVCDGSAELGTGITIGQQARKPFGLCYRTMIGNDTDGQEHGYKLHLIYTSIASPSEKDYATVNDSPETTTFSWECSTTPVAVPGHKPTSILIIDSTKATEKAMKAIEDVLYGKDAGTEPSTEATVPRMPLPDEVASIMAAAAA